jgi:hypothetical protein
MVGDILRDAPDRLKQKLFDAFDIQALHNKAGNQVTLGATITPPPPLPWPRSSLTARPPTWPPCSPPKIILRIWHHNLGGPCRHDHPRVPRGKGAATTVAPFPRLSDRAGAPGVANGRGMSEGSAGMRY